MYYVSTLVGEPSRPPYLHVDKLDVPKVSHYPTMHTFGANSKTKLIIRLTFVSMPKLCDIVSHMQTTYLNTLLDFYI